MKYNICNSIKFDYYWLASYKNIYSILSHEYKIQHSRPLCIRNETMAPLSLINS